MSNPLPDLRGFDARARQIISAAIAEGWTGRISSKGHWIGRAPDGKATMSVPRKMDDRGRTGANARATFAKWLRERHPDVTEAIAAAEAAADEGDPIAASILAGAAMKRASVVERHWSDGSVDYACAYPGCDYAAGAVARSVASHYGAAHRDAPVGPPTGVVPAVDYTEPITERTYRPTDRLVDALTAFLVEQRFDTPLVARDLATLFLTWAHERPDLSDVESRERRDLTDAEILDRIRGLVGRPLQNEVNEARVAAAEALARLAVAEAERDEAVARFQRVEADLAALRDLVDGLGR